MSTKPNLVYYNQSGIVRPAFYPFGYYKSIEFNHPVLAIIAIAPEDDTLSLGELVTKYPCPEIATEG